MARNDQQLIDMGTKALMKAASQSKGNRGNKGQYSLNDEDLEPPKLFNPKSKGKKKLSKEFEQGKAKKRKKVKGVMGYQYAGEVESDHPSQWYSKGKKK